MHYSSAQGIAPSEISDEVLASFQDALVTESIVPDPYEIYRGATKSWNNAAEHIPEWPQQRLTVPSRARTFSLPWGRLPADPRGRCRDLSLPRGGARSQR